MRHLSPHTKLDHALRAGIDCPVCHVAATILQSAVSTQSAALALETTMHHDFRRDENRHLLAVLLPFLYAKLR